MCGRWETPTAGPHRVRCRSRGRFGSRGSDHQERGDRIIPRDPLGWRGVVDRRRSAPSSRHGRDLHRNGVAQLHRYLVGRSVLHPPSKAADVDRALGRFRMVGGPLTERRRPRRHDPQRRGGFRDRRVGRRVSRPLLRNPVRPHRTLGRDNMVGGPSGPSPGGTHRCLRPRANRRVGRWSTASSRRRSRSIPLERHRLELGPASPPGPRCWACPPRRPPTSTRLAARSSRLGIPSGTCCTGTGPAGWIRAPRR